ncbi:MAG: VOC family protein [Alphaproteobacteria bacterium]|nr:VOC family protein [Alphaproteobacteria bacterium]
MYHGKPAWFELTTAPGQLAAAGTFYGKVLGWDLADAGMPGMTYHLASHGGDMVAGMMEATTQMPPGWLIHFDVDDVDAATALVTGRGGKVLHPPTDIPGTGRFAVVSDPQGAAFGLLQPTPMDPQPPAGSGAWNQRKEGHGNWTELMSTDPDAALDFYAKLLGWTLSQTMDMGDQGTYRIFAWNGTQIGGIMGLGHAPQSRWLPYFGVNGVAAAVDRVTGSGGTLIHGPQEVPGPAFVAALRDPQGADFALVGPLEVTA